MALAEKMKHRWRGPPLRTKPTSIEGAKAAMLAGPCRLFLRLRSMPTVALSFDVASIPRFGDGRRPRSGALRFLRNVSLRFQVRGMTYVLLGNTVAIGRNGRDRRDGWTQAHRCVRLQCRPDMSIIGTRVTTNRWIAFVGIGYRVTLLEEIRL
jgi:hypothetical protein